MSAVPPSGNGTIASELVVVQVCDELNTTLAGFSGREYISPPHDREQAMVLVELLLGSPPRQPQDRERPVWRRALAGGQRTIALQPSPR